MDKANWNFKNIGDALEFYRKNGFRCMPIIGVKNGCTHKESTHLDQCIGKVPRAEHWPDKKTFDHADFNDGDNLALIMGRQTDGRWFVGFDIDGELDLSQFMQLPETLECKTSRGRHLIFEVEPDSPLGNWNDMFSTRSKTTGYKYGYHGALDLKYCRGAMVSPPSISKSGEEYSWVNWRQPAVLPRSEIIYLIRKRKAATPDIKRYAKWSADPSHKDKNP